MIEWLLATMGWLNDSLFYNASLLEILRFILAVGVVPACLFLWRQAVADQRANTKEWQEAVKRNAAQAVLLAYAQQNVTARKEVVNERTRFFFISFIAVWGGLILFIPSSVLPENRAASLVINLWALVLTGGIAHAALYTLIARRRLDALLNVKEV